MESSGQAEANSPREQTSYFGQYRNLTYKGNSYLLKMQKGIRKKKDSLPSDKINSHSGSFCVLNSNFPFPLVEWPILTSGKTEIPSLEIGRGKRFFNV
ncbi:hypothetical protein CDAR_599341 [Caerostris darwini]|uniref:Ycf15 n=1 Tax=Caerostris darwini TaxID=1538125 RepID=A0AAV4M8M5_9ARAC|nr:hypothetical protein CDAR_599341 [Caerostris darwini]